MANVLSVVSYPFLPARTGGQKAIAQFYQYFSRYETLTCAGVTVNDNRAATGYRLVKVFSASAFRYINPGYFFRLRRLLRETGAEFLLLEHPYYGWLGIMLKKWCGVKLVVRSHNIEGNRWRSLGKWWWPLLWRYERFTHRHADFNIFIQDAEKNYAIRHFGLAPATCHTMTFGLERSAAPAPEEKQHARELVCALYALDAVAPILLINGAFQYGPNAAALENLLVHINPLLQVAGRPYQLVVCGMDIPLRFSEKKFPQVYFLGFVEDLGRLLTAADVFIHPVTRGGGIKTKLVEALGYGLNAVSSTSGAIGVDPALCNGKLTLVADDDWSTFAAAILIAMTAAMAAPATTPPEFYDQFNWDRLAARTAAFLQS